MLRSIRSTIEVLMQIRNPGLFWRKVSFIINNEGVYGIIYRLVKISRNDYTKWIKKFDTLSGNELKKIEQSQFGFSKKPLISIIMPVFNPKPEWLEQAIESVCRQSYPFWELCIADDASTNADIRKILIRFSTKDPRIKVVFREKNGHISACSNSALEIATGDWIALLDHDDMISSTALYWNVEAINKDDDIRLIYSDEDKINRSGIRSDPYFKSDWNLDLFYSHNMFSHIGVYHAGIVRQAGGFRIGFEGSQDYDLALRCIELIESKQIYHIPRVLYHWRIHNKSTAYSVKSKPYAMKVGEAALNEHFLRCDIKAEAQLIEHGYKICYKIPQDIPLVSIIIPTKDGLSLIRQCIESIVNLTSYQKYEIIVVDNGTKDPGTLAYLNKQKKENDYLRVIRSDGPFNYSALNNLAVREANGELIALLNNDVQVISKEWLTEMVRLAIQPGIGAVGAKLYYPDDTVQHAGIILGLGKDRIAGCAHNRISKKNNGYFGRASLTNSFLAVTGACLVVKKSLYEKINGFDEVHLPVSYNDVDFCLRLVESGYRNVFTPFAELYHQESASRGNKNLLHDFDKSSLDYFRKRWSHLILNDPSYNPNLTLDFSDFSYAWPPRITKV